MYTRGTYRNIPYARAERFGEAVVLPFVGASTHSERGPVAPQAASRMAGLLGPQAELSQRESCQVLSIFTGSGAAGKPVLVWFHGGASITGGGELPWYDGGILAEELDVVVVTVTSRLGALGFFTPGDDDVPSPATTDHLAALRWIHRNIHHFGGDPERVTVFGQSAGAFAIEVLLRWGAPVPLQGAVLQSGFLSQESIRFTAREARARSEAFEDYMGGRLRSVRPSEIVQAQVDFAKALGVSELWAPVRPQREEAIAIPILAGATRDDSLPFVTGLSGSTPAARTAGAHVDEAVRRRNYFDVHRGNLAVLGEVGDQRIASFAYDLQWSSPTLGAPHCIELPFLFGNAQAWRDAPMLEGISSSEIAERGRWLRAAWGNFARDQHPGPGWSPFEPEMKHVNVLTTERGKPALKVRRAKDVWVRVT